MSNPEDDNSWLNLSGPPEPLPNTVHIFEPLEIYLTASMLTEVVRESLQRLDTTRDMIARTPDRNRDLEHARRQRLEMLEWLGRCEPGCNLFVALYPISECETQEPMGEDL